MSPREVVEFEAQEGFAYAIRVRVWDDHAKVPGVLTPSFDDYVPLLRRVLSTEE